MFVQHQRHCNPKDKGLLLILQNPKWRTLCNIGVRFLQWWHKVVFHVIHSPLECQVLEISATKYSFAINFKFWKQNLPSHCCILQRKYTYLVYLSNVQSLCSNFCVHTLSNPYKHTWTTVQNKYVLRHQIILSEVKYFSNLQNQFTSINPSLHYCH